MILLRVILVLNIASYSQQFQNVKSPPCFQNQIFQTLVVFAGEGI